MKIAGDCGTHNQTLGYLLSLLPVLALVAMSSGCAGLSSVGDNRTGLSGAFWNRSDKTTKVPGYDLYADAGAVARPEASEEIQVATKDSSKDSKEKRKDAKTDEPAPDLVAQEDTARSKENAARRKRTRTGDTSIRVTLGRPESLPTLSDSVGTDGPILASAATTNWSAVTPSWRRRRQSSMKSYEKTITRQSP